MGTNMIPSYANFFMGNLEEFFPKPKILNLIYGSGLLMMSSCYGLMAMIPFL
jgi:hypothetical protein